jgi:hypothetical protein
LLSSSAAASAEAVLTARLAAAATAAGGGLAPTPAAVGLDAATGQHWMMPLQSAAIAAALGAGSRLANVTGKCASYPQVTGYARHCSRAGLTSYASKVCTPCKSSADILSFIALISFVFTARGGLFASTTHVHLGWAEGFSKIWRDRGL